MGICVLCKNSCQVDRYIYPGMIANSIAKTGAVYNFQIVIVCDI